MASSDEHDSTNLERGKEDYTRDLGEPPKGLRVGLSKEYFSGDTDADIQTALQNMINLFKAQGAETAEVSLPQTSLLISVYYVLVSTEVSTNLSCFSGIHYSHRAAQFGDLEEIYSNTRTKDFSSEIERRIMIGTYILNYGYCNVYYLGAQELCRLVTSDFQAVLGQYDFILAPAAPVITPRLGGDIHNPV